MQTGAKILDKRILEVTTAPDLTTWFRQRIQGKTLLLLSGGSSAKLAVDALQKLPHSLLSKLSVTLTDERFGAPGHADSNWQLLLELGLSTTSFHTIPVLTSATHNIVEASRGWQLKLQSAREQSDSVLAVFGIGADSHIAGLKPHCQLLNDATEITGSYTANDWPRITITPQFFPYITSCVVYAHGPEKEHAIHLLHDSLDETIYPDQLIKQTGDFTVYYQTEGVA